MTDETASFMSMEDAIARLRVVQDYDVGSGPEPCVHTLAQGGAGMLLGAHWPLHALEDAIREWGVKEAGPMAEAMHHGLVMILDDGKRTIFLETVSDPR